MLPDPDQPPPRPGRPTTTGGAAAGIVARGRGVHLGAEGDLEVIADVGGRHRLRHGGALAEANGYDGAAGWAVDWSGVARSIALRELDLARLLALGVTDLWREAIAGDGILLGFPGRPVLGLAEVDAGGRLRAMELDGPGGPIRYRFGDHRDVGGRAVAGTVEVRQGDLVIDQVVIDEARALDAPPRWAAPVAEPADALRVGAELPLRRAPSGHLLIEAALDGETGWFVLDTGAQLHVVTPSWARRLALPRRGTAPLTSVLGTVAAPIVQARSLAVGPLAIAAPHLVELDLAPFGAGLGVEPAGVIGFGLFRRAVAEVDLPGRVLRLHPLDAPPALDWHPMLLDHAHPIVAARLPSIDDAWLRLDLGAAGGAFGHLVMTRPAAAAVGRIAFDEVAQVGVYRFGLGRVPWVALGGRRYEDVEAAFALDADGIFGCAYTAGQIGAALVSDARVVLDPARGRFALR